MREQLASWAAHAMAHGTPAHGTPAPECPWCQLEQTMTPGMAAWHADYSDRQTAPLEPTGMRSFTFVIHLPFERRDDDPIDTARNDGPGRKPRADPTGEPGRHRPDRDSER